MGKKPAVIAAGAVVFREKNGETQVLIVHRPEYGDWTIPKGKPHPDEDLPVTAVREVYEETGAKIRLGQRLPKLQYRVVKGKKVVYFWVGQLLSQRPRKPDREVDKVKWLPVAEARAKLTYADEVTIVDEALIVKRDTIAMLIVRHGKAMDRKHWSGDDFKRSLSARGRKQSETIGELLHAFGVKRVLSSTSKRCAATVEPFCLEYGVQLEGVGLLTEEEADGNDDQVQAYVESIAADAKKPTALCGHRPVLPAMQKGLGIEPRSMLTGETLVVHLRNGKVVASETHKSTF